MGIKDTRVKLSDQRSEVLPDGSASQPGKELCHFQIASLDPDQRSGLARSGPVNHHPQSGWLALSRIAGEAKTRQCLNGCGCTGCEAPGLKTTNQKHHAISGVGSQ